METIVIRTTKEASRAHWKLLRDYFWTAEHMLRGHGGSCPVCNEVFLKEFELLDHVITQAFGFAADLDDGSFQPEGGKP